MDREGVHENIGSPQRRYLMNKLQSAIQEQASPLLISASLWENFLEKRESIKQMSLLPNTPEKKTLELYRTINEELCNAYQDFRQRGFDPIQSTHWMLSIINEKYYLNPEEFVPDSLNAALMSALTPFHPEEWEGYTDHSSLVLLIPKKYIEEKKASMPPAEMPGISEKEYLLGLKVDHLTRLTLLEDPVYCHLQLQKERADVQSLFQFFVTRQDCALPYFWNVVLSGHGGNFYQEVPEPLSKTLIADLTCEEFRDLLDFFENKISLKCLCYATCYGSGNHIKMIFDANMQSTYSYAIISDCLGDSASYTFWNMVPLPSFGKNALRLDQLSYDEKTGWSLELDYRYQWKKYFQSVADNSFDNSLFWLSSSLSHIIPSLVCTTPVVRLPHASSFMTVLPETYFQISDLVLEYKEGNTLEPSANTKVVLLETSYVHAPLVLENRYTVPWILSLLPGNSLHFLQKLTLQTNQGLLDAFWPLEGDFFKREFLIEELIFPAKDFPLCETWNIQTDTVVCRNVLISVQGTIMHIFLQTESGNSFMLVANKAEQWPGRESGLKGVYPVIEECSLTYLEKYSQAKEKLISSR